jgi:IPP transferase
MLDQGLLDETEAIERSGGFSPTSEAAIGYAECRDFLRGRYKDRTELRNRIRRNTHQLIRRQTTWLRRLGPAVVWLPPDTSVDGLHAGLATPDSGPSHRSHRPVPMRPDPSSSLLASAPTDRAHPWRQQKPRRPSWASGSRTARS